MIQHVIDHLKPLCSQILISANTDEYNQFGYRVIPDIVMDIGPAGGLVSCLPHSLNRKNIILSCDLPYTPTELLESLLEFAGEFDITILKSETYLQPLCAVYSKDILDTLRVLVREGHHSLQFLVRQFKINIIEQKHIPDIDLIRALRNINSLEDLDRLIP
jgi:molybdopterin-guanine dinucleotide biosynthesis protein A